MKKEWERKKTHIISVFSMRMFTFSLLFYSPRLRNLYLLAFDYELKLMWLYNQRKIQRNVFIIKKFKKNYQFLRCVESNRWYKISVFVLNFLYINSLLSAVGCIIFRLIVFSNYSEKSTAFLENHFLKTEIEQNYWWKLRSYSDHIIIKRKSIF